MKTTLDLMQSQVNELGSSLHTLHSKKESIAVAAIKRESEVESSNEGMEDVSDVLEELNQSLDNGEIDLETYGSSLRFALGYEGKVMPKGQMTPMMSSTPIVKRSLSRTQPAAALSTPHAVGNPTPATSAHKSFVHEKTPIKKPSNSFLGVSYQSLSALSTPAATPVERVTVARVSSQLENVTIPTNQPANQLTSSKPAALAPKVASLPLIEPILEQEKPNVNLWLGTDITELNQAIPTINQLVQRKRLEICADGTQEAGFTVEEVATACNVLPKKAKAVVLLLCTLKRLKLVRGETMAYSVLSGNTLKN